MTDFKGDTHPPSRQAVSRDFPPDIARLLEVLARIERRRQARLRSLPMKGAS